MSAKLILVCLMGLLCYCNNSHTVGGPASNLEGFKFSCFRRRKTQDANPCAPVITVTVAQPEPIRQYREPMLWTKNERQLFCMGFAAGVFTAGLLFKFVAILKHEQPKFKLE